MLHVDRQGGTWRLLGSVVFIHRQVGGPGGRTGSRPSLGLSQLGCPAPKLRGQCPQPARQVVPTSLKPGQETVGQMERQKCHTEEGPRGPEI